MAYASEPPDTARSSKYTYCSRSRHRSARPTAWQQLWKNACRPNWGCPPKSSLTWSPWKTMPMSTTNNTTRGNLSRNLVLKFSRTASIQQGKLELGHQSGNRPVAHGMRPATVQALGAGEPGRAVRTDGLQLEDVEHLPARSARPKVSQGWRCFAPRTGKPVATR